ncbi:hypothetical protein BdWA1_002341 [Babesia duncani]|uniref:RNA-editing substrate-binding complex 6 protein domain-containing protein n=1 Tax=Babesia duncani TaxID=323732 RepID=A0AAD9UNG3_9APIC|nr:hypothetical protein BdWA1_002341 [Babesia duncani]
MMLVKNFFSMSKSFSTATRPRRTIPLGELYPPRDNNQKILHAQIVGQVPLNMIPDWLERIQYELEKRSPNDPREFSETKLRYASSEKDRVISTLLRTCVNYKPSNSNVGLLHLSQSILEMISQFNSIDAGIILRCLCHLGISNTSLELKLIQIIAKRTEPQSINAQLSALCVLANNLKKMPSDHVNYDDTKRLYSTLCSRCIDKVGNLTLDQLARFANVTLALNNMDYLDRIANEITCKGRNFNTHEFTSDIVTSLAVSFSIEQKPLYDLLANYIESQENTYNIDQLVALANAYTKFGVEHRGQYFNLFVHLANSIVAQSSKLESKHVAVAANAFSRIGIFHEKLMYILEREFVLNLVQYDPRQISMILHAFSKIGMRPNHYEFIWQNCLEKMDTFGWQSLAMLLQAYAKSGNADPAIIRGFAKRFSELLEQQSIERIKPHATSFVSVLYSFTKMLAFENYKVLLSLLEASIEQLQEYNADIMANLAFATAQIYKSVSPDGNLASALIEASHSALKSIAIKIQQESSRPNLHQLVKIVTALQDANLGPLGARAVWSLSRRNVHLLNKIPHSQALAMIRAFSTLGINDQDLLAILKSSQKKGPHFYEISSKN